MDNRKWKQNKTEPRDDFRGSRIRYGKRPKKRRVIVWKRFLPALVLSAVFLYASVQLVRYAVRSISTRQVNMELQVAYEQAEAAMPTAQPQSTQIPEPTSEPVHEAEAQEQKRELLNSYQYISDAVLPAAGEMLEKNDDAVAWLRIPGVVSLPVVYRDNSFYLDHDFYGNRNESGTLFLDEAHPLAHDTQYMVIHGHNMHDGSMFGLLSHYRKDGYMQEHSVVYLDTLYRQEQYEAIGVLFLPIDVRSEGYVPYTGMRRFRSLEQFDSFAEMMQENALHWKEGAQMDPEDALLALSTCYEDNRIVVLCRRVSP